MDINVNLLQWSKKPFDKKSSGDIVKNEITSTKELAEELHKLIIRKFQKRQVHSSFIGKDCGCRSSRYAIDR